MKKKVVVSWSSGKDSTLTLLRLLEDDRYTVVGLYTTYVGGEVPFQATPLNVVEMQAQLVGLPLVKIELPKIFPSNDEYQALVVNGLQRSGLDIEAVAFGDMFCNGIAEYRRSYIEPAGWECLFPLLGEESNNLANEIVTRGIETILVSIDREQLSDQWCGHRYSNSLIESLPNDVDPCGENGEFHTLVTTAPCFKGSLIVDLLDVSRDERFSYQRYHATLLLNNEELV